MSQAAERPAAASAADELLRLVEQIYGAARDAALWPHALEAMMGAVRGETAILVARCRPHPLLVVCGYHAAAWEKRIHASLTAGEVVSSRSAILGQKFVKANGAKDGVERITVRAFPDETSVLHAIGQEMPVEDAGQPYLLFLRREAVGSFEQSAQRLCSALTPHLARAISLHGHMARMQAEVAGAHAILNAFEHAVLRVDGGGRVVFLSRAAETMIRQTPEIDLRDNQLSLTDQTLHGQMSAAILAAMHAEAHAPVSHSLFLGAAEDRRLQMTILPAPLSHPDAGAMVLLTDSTHAGASRAKTLRHLYRLSPSEARVADLLEQGMMVREIAGHLRLNMETVRFHVKRLLAKTGTRRQAELMKLMFSLPGL